MTTKLVVKKRKGFNAVKEIRREFRALSLAKPTRPVDADGVVLEPRVPHDLTVLTDQGLGRLHSEFACLMAYCQAALGWIEAQKLVDRRAARMTRAEAKVRYEGKATLMEASCDLDAATRAKEEKSLVSDAVATITSAMLASLTVGRDATSREMTRRIAAKELMGTTR